jgi:hypothetical protein
MDLFVVPTIGFKLLYGFVIVRVHRRDLVWINVTTNPTAEWVNPSEDLWRLERDHEPRSSPTTGWQREFG